MSQLPEQIEPQQVQAIPVGPDPQMQMISQIPPQAIPMGQTALPMTQQNLAPGFNTTAMANQGLSMNATDSKLQTYFLTFVFYSKFSSDFTKLLRFP